MRQWKSFQNEFILNLSRTLVRLSELFGGTIIEILIKEKRNFNKKRKRVKSVVH